MPRLLDVRIAEIDRTIAYLRELRSALASVRWTAGGKRGEDAVVCSVVEADASDRIGLAEGQARQAHDGAALAPAPMPDAEPRG